jgi:hypothetical protein
LTFHGQNFLVKDIVQRLYVIILNLHSDQTIARLKLGALAYGQTAALDRARVKSCDTGFER